MKVTTRAICHFPGCSKSNVWEFDSRKEARAHFPKEQEWRCARHDALAIVLSPSVVEHSNTLVSKRSEHGRLYWGILGFIAGQGWRAWCDDFPEGTKITTTVKIELPHAGDEGGKG